MSSTPMASQPSLRFLGILKPPDSDHLEIDEGDLFWSSSSESSPYGTSPSPPTHLNRSRNHFKTAISGLSAALNDDNHLVRRKSTLNPTVSTASNARIIPQVNSKPNPNGVAKFYQSAPVNVPAWPKHKKGGFDAFEDLDETDFEIDEDEMVPPHVIVARAHVTLSVFEGVGRTLKGRDLRRVRNAVFQQTDLGTRIEHYHDCTALCKDAFAGKKVMQIGALILANASIDCGRIHNPSPQIRPDATAGTIRVAFLLLSLCHVYTTRLPIHISIAKEAPTRKGTAIAIGRGIHFPTFFGDTSFSSSISIAEAQSRCKNVGHENKIPLQFREHDRDYDCGDNNENKVPYARYPQGNALSDEEFVSLKIFKWLILSFWNCCHGNV
nr:Chaperone protein like [Ipomoea batatas]